MPTSNSHYFRETVESAERHGIDGDALLATVGLTREQVFDPIWRGDVQILARLIQLVWYALDDEFMGFCARPAKPGTFALMTHTILAESSLERALSKCVLFINLVHHESMTLRLSYEEESIRLSVRMFERKRDPNHYFLQFLMTVWSRLLGWLGGAPVRLIEATFTFSRIDAYARELQYIWHCPHSFDGEENSLLFDREHLQRPIVRDHAELKRFLSTAPLGFMMAPGEEDSFARKVRTTLMGNRSLPLDLPDLPTVARDLNMAEQTLRRRLRDESTSYREIKENIRRDIAVHRLLSTSMPVQKVGELVGYWEVRAFSRAFKEWTGSSPAEYRQKMREQF